MHPGLGERPHRKLKKNLFMEFIGFLVFILLHSSFKNKLKQYLESRPFYPIQDFVDEHRYSRHMIQSWIQFT